MAGNPEVVEWITDPERTHALIVAVEDYRTTSLTPLPGLAETAREFADWLRGFAVPDENIVMLGAALDGDEYRDTRSAPGPSDSGGPFRSATAANVLVALLEDIPSRSGDLLWIFWAGHGKLDPAGRPRLLLADASDRALHNIDANELLQLYHSTFLSQFSRQIVVIDACQSRMRVGEAQHWPEPLPLPRGHEYMRGLTQHVWLPAGAGDAAGYSPTHRRAHFSAAVLDSVRESDSLYWTPTLEQMQDALDRKIAQFADGGTPSWEVPRPRHQSGAQVISGGSGLTSDTRRPEPWPAHDPVLEAYLRWLAAAHERTSAAIANREIFAGISEAPWVGSLAADGATSHMRVAEARYVHGVPGREDPARTASNPMAAQPFPTYLAVPGTHIDQLDLSRHQAESAEDLLDRSWRSIVLGDPGSGKTTLARRLVLREAHRDVADPGRLWRLPVLCSAAELAHALAGADVRGRYAVAQAAIKIGWHGVPRDVFSDHPITPAGLARLAAGAAARGRLLLVVDGLDEVSTMRERLWLVGLLNELIAADGSRLGWPDRTAGNQFLATSRIVGYHASPLEGSVRQLLLLPMDAAAQRATGEFWLRRYAEQTGQGPRRGRAVESRFRQICESNDETIRQLIANPVLLVCLVSVAASDAGGRRRLPQGFQRSDLYAHMVAEALDRASKRPGFTNVPRQLMFDMQAAVAYQIHRTASNGLLEPETLRRCVDQALASMPEPPCSADEALGYLLDGLALIVGRAQNLFGFLHRTFQEYLAGQWLIAGNAAERIRLHLGDPHWTEPIRLGLGRLGRQEPVRFRALLADLFAGTGGERAAALVANSLTELGPLRAQDIAAAVAAVLAADAHEGAGAGSTWAAHALAPLLSSPTTLDDGERPVDVVSRALAHALGERSPALVAAAARAVQVLDAFDQRTAEALFRAQRHDSADQDWATVRALHALRAKQAADQTRETAPDAAATVWRELSEKDRAVLNEVRVSSVGFGARPGPARHVLAPELTPMRGALDAATVERLENGPVALQRVVLCLYDPVAFHDFRRWTAERKHLEAQLRLADTPAEQRHAAAVRLDVVVSAVLNPSERNPPLAPEHITVDSPLTGRLLDWIGAQTSVAEIAERLRALAADTSLDADTRGDALAAWFALGTAEAVTELRDFASRSGSLDEDVRRRLAWRMGRARFLLGDAASRVDIGSLAVAFSRRRSGEAVDLFTRTAIPALRGLTGVAPRAGEWERSPRLIREQLVATVLGSGRNTTYNVAVMLDVAGAHLTAFGPAGLADILATAHITAAAYGAHARDWSLDPLAPRHGSPVAEALTALAGLSPRLTFLRCWLLDQLAPLLTAEGFAVEGLCLALYGIDTDPASVARTVRRLAPGLEGLPVESVDGGESPVPDALIAALVRSADGLSQPYPRARAKAHLARLLGSQAPPPSLPGLLRAIEEPSDRLRFLELWSALGLEDARDGVRAEAAACAARIEDPVDRALALARLARGGSPEEKSRAQEEFNRAFAEDQAAPDADLLSRPIRADSGFAAALLAYEAPDLRIPDHRPALRSWAILTCGAMCQDVLAALGSGDDGLRLDLDSQWRALADPEHRAEATRSLLRLGRTDVLELTAQAFAGLRALSDAREYEALGRLLAVASAPQRTPQIRAWRSAPDRRVADLAALLEIESGLLDPAAVEALPRLLLDLDDRVRIRAGVATSVKSRGYVGAPRLRASEAGAKTLAALVRITEDDARDRPRLSADLWWALADVVWDSMPVLTRTLDLLAAMSEYRLTLLSSIRRTTPQVLALLPGLLLGLAESEQIALVDSLYAIAEDPSAAGVDETRLAQVAASLDAVARRAADPVLARLLCLRGVLAEPTEAMIRELLEIAAAGKNPSHASAAILAKGAVLGLSHQLARAGDVSPDVVKTLRQLALVDDEDLAAAAVIALRGVGDGEYVDRLVAEEQISATVVLWARLGAMDTKIIGDHYRRLTRETARYVSRPNALSGADAIQATTEMIDELLALACRRMDEWPARRREHTSFWHAKDKLYIVISVLAELAHEHAGGLRAAVDQDHPNLRGLLASELMRSTDWVVRMNASRLLVLLGHGDAFAINALLDTALDTDLVRQALLRDIPWFNGIEPDGFAVLLDAVRDPRPSRAHIAVQILASLLTPPTTLGGREYAAALDALRRSPQHPQADTPLLAEHSAAIMTVGTFGDSCRRLIAAVLGEPRTPPPHVAQPTVYLEATDTAGHPINLAVPAQADSLEIPLLEYQAEYAGSTGEYEVRMELVIALRNAASAARQAQIPLAEILEYASGASDRSRPGSGAAA